MLGRLLLGIAFSLLVADAAAGRSLRGVHRRVNPSVVVVHTELKDLPDPVAGEGARSDESVGPGFAVTSNVARKLMIEEKRPWMGVEALLIEGAIADSFNLPQTAGLLVQSVAEGSLGERLGLREGAVPITVGDRSFLAGSDTILEMLGLRVRPGTSTLLEIQAELDRLKPGDSAHLKVLRQGEPIALRTALLP